MKRQRLDPAVAQVRSAVRAFLSDPKCRDYVRCSEIYVGLSGGADSLALTEAAAHVGHRMGLRVGALIVDHQLQPGSAQVARAAAANARKLGADATTVIDVRVAGRGGPEAAARRARYAALRSALQEAGSLVLLGHTMEDQAESVLLGLGRGSGPRSIAGMRPVDPPWGRPLLDVQRATTRAACIALGVEAWNDPHNVDPRFTRVRLRHEAFPLLEDVLSGGVAAAMARTATQLRDDAEALDTLAAGQYVEAGREGELDVRTLANVPAALRRRVLRLWLLDGGVSEVTDRHLRAVDALIANWHGQGGVWLPGNLEASRAHGRLTLLPPERTKGD